MIIWIFFEFSLEYFYFPQRYVPAAHHLRETSEQQKIKLQERMSGLKHPPELSVAGKVSGRHKFRRARQVAIDPVTERKVYS